MRIFLIDDEASARNSMERIVRQVRPAAELATFSRGQAALDAIEQEGLRPDVVFSDIQMPGLSGLSLAVLVVEAAKKSGSLITADLAMEQGRDVFAVPGNVGLEACEGSNLLLQEGAMLATCGWDVVQCYQARFPDRIRRANAGEQLTLSPQDAKYIYKPEKQEITSSEAGSAESNSEKRIDNAGKRNYIDLQRIKDQLTEDEMVLVELLRPGQKHVDDIIAESGMPAARVLASLTLLEVKGFVVQQPGKRFDLNIE